MWRKGDAYLLVAPYEADNHGLFLSALHAVDCTDLQLGAVDGAQQRREERHLRLVSIVDMSVGCRKLWMKQAYGVITAI